MCHSRLRGFTGAGLGVVGFIRVSVGSAGRAKGWSGSLVLASVHSGAPSDRRVHSGSHGFTPARVGFIKLRLGSLMR